MLSCQSRRPNRCNAKDMWHKPGIFPGGPSAALFDRPLSALSDSSSRHTGHLFFPLSFSFISMVLDLLTPSPFTTLHCLFSFASRCHTGDLWLHPRLSFSSLAFPLPRLLISSLFPCLCLRCFAWYLLFRFVLLSIRGQNRAPCLSQVLSCIILGAGGRFFNAADL